MKVVVLGAGIGGLAVASRLRGLGYDVILLEKNKDVGGKASLIKLDGYSFDAGPSLFTYPDWLDDVFLSCNKNPRDYYTYQELTTITRYFFNDKSFFDVFSDLDKTALSVESATLFSKARFTSLIHHWKRIYTYSEKTFLKGKILINWSFFKTAISWLFNIGFRSIFLSMASYNKLFVNNQKVELFLNRFATYTGSSPYNTPAFMNQLSVVELSRGAYYPNGGIYSIPKALEKLAIDLGVSIRKQANVVGISKNSDKWNVITSVENFSADLVISNMDFCVTKRLLGEQYELPTTSLSSSGVVFYWGVAKQFDKLKLHNVFFSENYKKEFSQIFNSCVIPEKPTVYVNVTSKIDANHAKNGCENWFVMVNVPSSLEICNKESIAKLKKAVINMLSSHLAENIEPLIEQEQLLTPNTLAENTNSYKGSIYGLNQNSLVKIMSRNPNKDNKHKVLFHVGGTVHPGGGIPLALLSAKNTAELIKNEYYAY